MVTTSVAIYSDPNCNNLLTTAYPDKGRAMGPTTHPNHGPNVCINVDKNKVKSVRGFLKE